MRSRPSSSTSFHEPVLDVLFRSRRIALLHRFPTLSLSPLAKMEDTGLPGTPSVRRVRQRYLQSFSELQEIGKPANKESVETFTATLKRALDRSDDIVLLMARGLQELASRSGSCYQESRLHSGDRSASSADMERVQAFLDSFYQVTEKETIHTMDDMSRNTALATSLAPVELETAG